ncbi:MarR family transcriptional regulator [Kitasatospora sp. NPDC028055]|uniref:MarR family transcriptional regulator n=1 Tax=Kitasatospora sp. NPDC028055 TaxID=3155653 RepID=UPI0033CBE7B2
MTLKEYPHEVLAAQPIGAWSAEVFHRVVGALREQLAVEDLTQPHWWTLNHAAGAPGRWNRTTLTQRLARYDDLGTDFDTVFDDLTARGWLLEDTATGAMSLTPDGEAARLRARDRNHRVHLQAHQGVDEADFVTTINVLRRITANMGGDGNLPD